MGRYDQVESKRTSGLIHPRPLHLPNCLEGAFRSMVPRSEGFGRLYGPQLCVVCDSRALQDHNENVISNYKH